MMLIWREGMDFKGLKEVEDSAKNLRNSKITRAVWCPRTQ